MLKTEEYIKSILSVNDEVILPDLGLLKKKYTPAQINSFASVISTPSVSIEFVSEEKNHRFESSEDEYFSVNDLKHIVSDIKQKTNNNGKKYHLNDIGDFFVGSDGKIQFSKEEGSLFSSEFFGFSDIELKPIVRKPVEIKPTVVSKPVSAPLSKSSTVIVTPKKQEELKPVAPQRVTSETKPAHKESIVTPLIKEKHVARTQPIVVVKEELNDEKLTELKTGLKEKIKQERKRSKWLVMDGYFITLILLVGLLIFQWNKYDIKINDLKNLTWHDLKNDFISIGIQLKELLQKDSSLADKKNIEEPGILLDSSIKINDKDEINYAQPENIPPSEANESTLIADTASNSVSENTNVISELEQKNIDTFKKSDEAKSTPPAPIQNISSNTNSAQLTGMYRIIMGSFQDKNNALKLMKKLQSQFYKAVIFQSESGNFRVGIDGYNTESEAKAQLDYIRTNINPNAWILNQKSRI